MRYETEKRFFAATKTGYDLETLLIYSVEQLNDHLKNNDLPNQGSFQMDVGYAIFETVDESEEEKTIRLDCYTFNGGKHSVWITFDQRTNRIIGWNEI
ncbi:competence type IV pilus minor pilin ComGG [Fervidibacillus halotolerans]|uniref:Competence type IV pilus minor pilin ComGG n=1 Tax=Fervidibacillus halotolerans TaxID=2980027 RepID=A0A9E8RXP6_9BACI|nr:competence type IV pilus minor pilin ComGG [Fervidibacillus halotolerans]WAA11444.1 competence type IV pilus minor pilin ComGG [Fervidibacillus halotolerans]